MKRLLLLYNILILSCIGMQAQQAFIDTTVMLIGDQNHLTIQWKVDDRIESVVIKDEILEDQEGIELVKNAQLRHQLLPDGHLYEKVYTFSMFDAGQYEIPSIDVEWTSKNGLARYSTPKFQIEVMYPSLDSMGEDLAPIKPIIEAPFNWYDYRYIVYALGVLLLLILVAFLAYKQQQRIKNRPAPVVEIDPHEAAFRAIQALEDKGYLEQGAYEPFQIELTQIIREFIEGKYGIPAPHMTTREIMQEIRKLSIPTVENTTQLSFPAHKLDTLKELLNMADLVKFAKAETQYDFNRRMLFETKDIIKISNTWN